MVCICISEVSHPSKQSWHTHAAHCWTMLTPTCTSDPLRRPLTGQGPSSSTVHCIPAPGKMSCIGYFSIDPASKSCGAQAALSIQQYFAWKIFKIYHLAKDTVIFRRGPTARFFLVPSSNGFRCDTLFPEAERRTLQEISTAHQAGIFCQSVHTRCCSPG